MSSGKFRLMAGATTYEILLARPDAGGGVTLSGTRQRAGAETVEALEELRAEIADAGGDLRIRVGERVHALDVAAQGRGVWLGWQGRSFYVEPTGPARFASAAAMTSDELRAPMTGTVLEVRVAPGQRVSRDDVLAVLEAMKMEYRIVAPRDAEVATVAIRPGQRVELGTTLIRLREEGEKEGKKAGKKAAEKAGQEEGGAEVQMREQ
ncbi:MAG: biotin/lipoyl-binding protein [Gemmatimonadetes bacterium]|nr:biotin/lipoyl-binding protein [Gemmatimonadota bacterium]